MRRKTCAAHLFFQRLTTHPREIFFMSKKPVDYPHVALGTLGVFPLDRTFMGRP